MKRKDIKVILIYVLLAVGIVFFLTYMFKNSAAEPPTYDQVIQYFTNEEVTEFVLSENNILTMTLKNGNKVSYEVVSLSLFHADLGELITQQMAAGTLKGEYEPPSNSSVWLSILPSLILTLLLIAAVVYYFVSVNKNGGGKMNSFGRAKVKTPSPDGKNRVLFTDVAGADEEKEELQEVVEFLKNPAKYSKLGAKIPHGVLLMGPPGTGKTLLAKAVAGEAGVPFFSISGSDFVEMYVGVGASRVRDLFETARKAPASIVFIDEIDAVGRHRGAGLGGGHDEREQTLNQLLVEMDGFGAHDGIIVIAATNRPDILDPALLRPGRFDRQITVNYPDIKGREEILKVHARNKPLEDSVDLSRVAKTTSGFTGADLANLLNEAALLAARRGKSLIGMDDIEDAYIKVVAGPKKKTRVRKQEELYKTAIHEAGHAIIAHVLPHMDPVQQISIIPSGNALGYTLNPPAEDKDSVYRNELKEKIAMLLGGRAAEELMFDDISGGASNDIERATKIARQMVTRLGMSEVLGPRCFGGDQGEVFLGRDFSSSEKDYAGTTATQIDAEIHKIISEAHARAKAILSEHMDKMKFIADFLMKNEIMDGEQFTAAMQGNPTFEELEEMTEAKKRKSREENEQRARREREQQEKEQAEQQAAVPNLAQESVSPVDQETPKDE